MPDIVGIRFKNCGKIYNFEADGIDIHKGSLVVVESEFGLSIGNVVVGIHSISNPDRSLKKVLRLATEEDRKQKQDNQIFEKKIRDYCLERIMARGIPMKLACTEAALDRRKIAFYFTADGRIDFRELVKDLAAKFKTRIEMRQIGVRDKAKLIGGLGLCGKEVCCRVFLTSFDPISIKMAKQQELVLNTGKLSGVCGRLMCCLGYEYDDIVAVDSLISDEKISKNEEDELLEIVTEESEQKSPDIVNCAKELPADIPAQLPEKPKEQQIQEHSRRHRRRRRRRKGRFHLKSE